jgi:sugar (pentulose or hexulose) kinase
MSIQGYLGIDAGTQGLSVTLTDEAMQALAVGEGDYAMEPDLAAGCYEQHPDRWIDALKHAMADLRDKMKGQTWSVLAIGISGQMHGEALADAEGHALAPARLWCDARNEDEGEELTALLGVKMPKRITAARWLWTLRNQPEKAQRAAHLTTPGGWIAHALTGAWNLGIGDASGMFPMDQATQDYNQPWLKQFEALTPDGLPKLSALLPSVRKAGEEAGGLTKEAASWMGLPAGIPVAGAEGDQPAALAGSLIGDAGMISISLGTSVVANAVGDHPFEGVHPGIDHFCAADGKPINMVWLRNGTTYMNVIVDCFGAVTGGGRKAGFAAVIPQVLNAPADCGGLLALPFMDDEPGLGVSRGGTGLVCGINADNATPGNVAKAALLATLFNLRHGLDELDRQGFPRTELVLSGGLLRDPELGQLIADALNTPARILASGTEGSAWGAALLAKYRHLNLTDGAPAWSAFLKSHESGSPHRFTPNKATTQTLDDMYSRYLSLLEAHPTLEKALR